MFRAESATAVYFQPGPDSIRRTKFKRSDFETMLASALSRLANQFLPARACSKLINSLTQDVYINQFYFFPVDSVRAKTLQINLFDEPCFPRECPSARAHHITDMMGFPINRFSFSPSERPPVDRRGVATRCRCQISCQIRRDQFDNV